VLELLDAMSKVSSDSTTLRFIEREQYWLRGCDGQLAQGPIPADNEQLTLAFE
jgi:hypothetical protein